MLSAEWIPNLEVFRAGSTALAGSVKAPVSSSGALAQPKLASVGELTDRSRRRLHCTALAQWISAGTDLR
jgi:hypothetical protein